jgi:thymidylate synthase (FAD)
MGGDEMVALSARVSNGVFESVPTKDQKLINYLVKHRHGTPFEHSVFTFHVKVPLFVAREWQRHRIGSYNEISGRYVQFEPEFYIPSTFRTPAQDNKQGSVISTDQMAADWLAIQVEKWAIKAYDEYKVLLSTGLAKEMARMILPLNLYTQFYWTVNARSLMNFLGLRCALDAQWEIRMYALTIRDEYFAKIMPMTHGAWMLNGGIVP